MSGVEDDFDWRYRAVAARDARFDGWFVTAVTSTRVYCRPSCPAMTPKRENVRFLPSAAAAQREGFRACLRCRPDAAPGSPEWNYRADVVGRAMRLIADGVVDRDGVVGLAAQLGYTKRHVSRMLQAEIGAGPLTLARAQRAETARILIERTEVGLADVAFAAGFGSVRQFNTTIRDVYGRMPSQLRSAGLRGAAEPERGAITLRLPYREPLHAQSLVSFLGRYALPGRDEVVGDVYRCGLTLPYGAGIAELRILPGHVHTALRLEDVRDLGPAVARCRWLMDLDADPEAIDAVLSTDLALAADVAKHPGVRVPGAMDGFELAVRAMVSRRHRPRRARTILTALVSSAGTPDGDGRLRGFPSAAAVAAAADEALPSHEPTRASLRALAETVACGALRLDVGARRDEVIAGLLGVTGFDAWLANYVAMRVLRDPDIMLAQDAGVRRGAAALGLPSRPIELARHAKGAWAPWRSYATARLWRHA
jgi:AraC family transcriptional regulator of adaptative response / DNA-3-methyladenine glycosylase II